MLTLKRLPGWRTNMEANLIGIRKTPFEWGVHDCALFAATHVLAITGEDLSKPFVGQYTTALGAMKALKIAGYDDLLQLCRDKFPEIHISLCRFGDIVIISSESGGYAIGIILGEVIGVLTPNGYGVIRKSDKNIVTGFRIG
jgi:hypothetical protein